MASIIKSISVSLEFHQLAKQHKISWSEAARVGLSLILAERGVADYDNQLNIFRRMSLLGKKLSDTSQELFDLREKVMKQEEDAK